MKAIICMLIGAVITYAALTKMGVDGIPVVDAFVLEIKELYLATT